MKQCWPYKIGVPSSLMSLHVCRIETNGRSNLEFSLVLRGPFPVEWIEMISMSETRRCSSI